MHEFTVNEVNRRKLSANFFFYGLGIILCSIFLIETQFNSTDYGETTFNIKIVLIGILVLFLWYRRITQHFSYKKDRIKFKGLLTIEEEGLHYCGTYIGYDELTRVKIYAADFKGNYLIPNRMDLNNCLSTGNGNYIKLYYKSGQIDKKPFMLERKDELKKVAASLISLEKKGVILRNDLFKTMNLDTYDKIQAFKRENEM